jgi:hypothetical protein
MQTLMPDCFLEHVSLGLRSEGKDDATRAYRSRRARGSADRCGRCAVAGRWSVRVFGVAEAPIGSSGALAFVGCSRDACSGARPALH